MKQKDWVKIFKALGNENRLKIIRLLWQKKELPVGEIADTIHLSVKSTSKHIAILKNIGFFEGEGKQNSVYYSLNPDIHRTIKEILVRAMRQ